MAMGSAGGTDPARGPASIVGFALVVVILAAAALVRLVSPAARAPRHVAEAQGSPLRASGQHASVPIVHLAEPLALAAERAALLLRLGLKALTRIAGRLASLTARLSAFGGETAALDEASRRTHRRTRCAVRTRTMVVPRGFTDGQAIDDRISLEASYFHAQVTGTAEWEISPGASAPQFGRVVGVVFLSDCPPPRS